MADYQQRVSLRAIQADGPVQQAIQALCDGLRPNALREVSRLALAEARRRVEANQDSDGSAHAPRPHAHGSTRRITIRLPQDDLDFLDAITFETRSETVRRLIRAQYLPELPF